MGRSNEMILVPPMTSQHEQDHLRIQPTRVEEQRRDDTGDVMSKATRCYKRNYERKALLYEMYHAAIRRMDTYRVSLERTIGYPKHILFLKSCH